MTRNCVAPLRRRPGLGGSTWPAAAVTLLLAFGGCAGGSEEAAGPAPSLAIVDVTLLDPGSGVVSERAVVLIAGGRILATGSPTEVQVAAGVPAIDGAGLYLVPGLWDLHTHLSLLDDSVPPLLVTQGVTGVRDLGGDLHALEVLKRRIVTGELLGPRILHAGPTLNGAQNGSHHRVIDSPEAAASAVSELRLAGVDLLKTHNATEREVYFALLDSAREAGLAVAGHVPTGVSPLEACRAGQDSIEHIATLFEGTYIARFESEMEAFLAMADWLEAEAPELVRCFAEQQTLFVPTLRAYEVRAQRAATYDLPHPGWRFVSSELYQRWRDQGPPNEMDRNPEVIALRQSLVETGQDLVRRLHEAGAPIGAATDLGTGILPGYDLHREVELLADAGLTPREALWASVRGPGERSGGDPLTGRLVPRAPADLVLLRENAFDAVTALAEIEGVIINGRHLDRRALDGVLRSLEEDGPGGLDVE